LDRHVERRHGFVANEDLGLKGKSAGDPNALTLPPRELVGVAAHSGFRQADEFKELRDALASVLPFCEAMHIQWLADEVSDGKPWVERSVRVLEHHLHTPTQAAPACPRGLSQILPANEDTAFIRKLETN
jgi:hypothetical protein